MSSVINKRIIVIGDDGTGWLACVDFTFNMIFLNYIYFLKGKTSVITAFLEENPHEKIVVAEVAESGEAGPESPPEPKKKKSSKESDSDSSDDDAENDAIVAEIDAKLRYSTVKHNEKIVTILKRLLL